MKGAKSENKRELVKKAAEILNIPEQRIRIGLQRGLYPFGFAYQNEGSSQYIYDINLELVKKYKNGELELKGVK